MISERVSFLFSLGCSIAAGILMAIFRILNLPFLAMVVLLLLLTAALGLAAFRLYVGAGRYQTNTPPMAPRTEFTLLVAALCFFASSLFRLPALLHDAMIGSLLQVLILLLAAAACGLRFWKGEKHPHSGPLALLPIFSLCIHLMFFYRANSNQPDVQNFGYEIVTFSLLLLGLYVSASSKYKRRSPVSQRFWAMLSLASAAMEYALLLIAPTLLQQTNDMGGASLLIMAGTCVLMTMPLLYPAEPVILSPQSAPEPDDMMPEPLKDAAEAEASAGSSASDAAEEQLH